MKLKLFLIIMGISFLLLGTNLISAIFGDKYDVTFSFTEPDAELKLTHKALIITIKNLQDTSDNLDMKSILNETDFDINKVNNIKFSQYISEEVIKYNYTIICNPYNETNLINKTFNYTESVCLDNGCFWNFSCACEVNETTEISNCSKVIIGNYTIEEWNYKEKALIKTDKEEKTELRNTWEQISIQKAGNVKDTIKFKLSFDTPFSLRNENWGNAGTIYININGETFVDKTNSSWFNESKAHRRKANTSLFTVNQPFVANGSNCFMLGGFEQCGWLLYNTSISDYYFYYNDNTDIEAVGNVSGIEVQIPVKWETGNSSSYNPTQVFDVNYKEVYLMNDNSTSTINDSTSYAKHGTKKASNEPNEVTGKIGKAQDLDGTDDEIAVSSPYDIQHELTVEIWVNPDNLNGRYLVSQYNGAGERKYLFQIDESKMRLLLRADGDGSFLSTTASDTTLSASAWQHFAATWDGTTLRYYLNGTADGSPSAPGTLDSTTVDLIIGDISGGTTKFAGLIDNLKISNISRSATYINQSYRNAEGQSGYGNLGAEESAPPVAGLEITAHTTNPAIVYTNTDLKFNMTATDPDNASFTGYIQFYINGTGSGSEISQSMNNDTNTLIGTLINTSFTKGATLIVEYWAGNNKENTTKANETTVTVQNSVSIIQSNITSPDTVYTNTDFKLNLTASDLDCEYFTAYTQFYINGSSSGSVISLNLTNYVNTNVATLSNSDFDAGDTLIAEFWIGDCDTNISKENTTQVTVQHFVMGGIVKDSSNIVVNNANMIIINQTQIDGLADSGSGSYDISIFITKSNATGGWTYNIGNTETYLVIAYDPNNSTRDGDADPHIVVS